MRTSAARWAVVAVSLCVCVAAGCTRSPDAAPATPTGSQGSPRSAESSASPGANELAQPASARLVARPEAFVTIVEPDCSHCVDEAQRRAQELKPDEPALAWIRGRYDGGAIPLRFFLAAHRVISDTYGVFVYDPDAGFVQAFEPSLDYSFHGWRNGIMVIQHKDGTLFSTLSGRAFAGPRAGESLKPIPHLRTTWGDWLTRYPGAVAFHMYEKYRPVELPAASSAESVSTRPSGSEPGPGPDREVFGVVIGDAAQAWTIDWLRQQTQPVHGTLAGEDYVVLWYEPTGTAAAYGRQVEGVEPPVRVTLSLDPDNAAAPFVDEQTGSRWDIAGRAVAGPLVGKTLPWRRGIQCRQFAWLAEYPQSGLTADGTSATGEQQAAEKPRRLGERPGWRLPR